ncbi:MAG: hypothetical protein KY469_19940 [Actinobacteria bacterium]|nr:hypothetical protein [Actinomycetota bacterium]
MRQPRPSAGRHAAGPLPSTTAQRRLAAAIERDIGDLRVRVHEGLLRSELLLEMGRPEAAAEVLEESRILIELLHERLTSTVAAAAVEREAEAVLAEAVVAEGDERLQPATSHSEERLPSARGRLAGLVAAIASLITGLLFLAGPTTSQDPPALSVDAGGEPTRSVTSDRDPATEDGVEPAKPDSTLAAAALAVLEELGDGSDRPARASTVADDDGSDEGDGDEEEGWIERLLLSHFQEGPTGDTLSELGLESPDAVLPDGGPPVTQTIEENPAPIDDDADEPTPPTPDHDVPGGGGGT